MLSRREFGQIALAGLPFTAIVGTAKAKSVVSGVHLGVQVPEARKSAARPSLCQL